MIMQHHKRVLEMIILFFLSQSCHIITGFQINGYKCNTQHVIISDSDHQSKRHVRNPYKISKKHKPLFLSPDELTATTSSVLLCKEQVQEWRQYVPLAVSCLVILDILLGSPLANLALAPMKPNSDENSNSDLTKSTIENKNRERIDSDKLAQEALDKARNFRELRVYLETRKTGNDKISEMKKKFDNQLEKMDFD